MIGLDTNVVVRFLTDDDRKQSDAVKSRLRDIHHRGDKAMVSKIVLLETVWVLSSLYGFEDQQILTALDRFSQLPMVVLEDRDLLGRMVTLFVDGGPWLADQFILADYVFAGCGTVITFDKKARKLDGFMDVS